jgi:hypothetical protein
LDERRPGCRSTPGIRGLRGIEWVIF